jgi:PHP family Zn ribbon phosphoesterase
MNAVTGWDLTLEELIKVTNEKIADAIIKIREGQVKYIAGYDGVYGIPVFNEEDYEKLVEKQKKIKISAQKNLKDFK